MATRDAMKKLMIVGIVLIIGILVLLFLMPSGPSSAECRLNWTRMTQGIDRSVLSDSEIAGMVINEVQLPNTVGALAKECLLDGWRPPGMR